MSEEFILQLSERMGKVAVLKLVSQIEANPSLFEEMYRLIYHENAKVAWQAAWCCEHLCVRRPDLLLPHREELVQWALQEPLPDGQRRIVLDILLHLPIANPLPIALLNYCLDHCFDAHTSIGVQALCLKIAYRICVFEPDLLREFQAILANTERTYLAPATRSVIPHLLKKMKKQLG